jgi:hypothetical protein
MDPPALKFILTGVAASAAETVTFPLDLLKTRLQLEVQPAGTGGRQGVTAIASQALRGQGGPFAMYHGLSAAVLRHVPYSGIRVLVYEQLRSLAQPSSSEGQGGIVWVAPAMGLIAGALGQAAAVPADRVKVCVHACRVTCNGTWLAVLQELGYALAVNPVVKAGGWFGHTPMQDLPHTIAGAASGRWQAGGPGV